MFKIKHDGDDNDSNNSTGTSAEAEMSKEVVTELRDLCSHPHPLGLDLFPRVLSKQ